MMLLLQKGEKKGDNNVSRIQQRVMASFQIYQPTILSLFMKPSSERRLSTDRGEHKPGLILITKTVYMEHKKTTVILSAHLGHVRKAWRRPDPGVTRDQRAKAPSSALAQP